MKGAKYALILPLLLVFGSVFSQFKAEVFRPVLLEAKYGALLAFKGSTNSFILKFVSESMQPTGKPTFVIMDNHLIQATLIPFQKDFGFTNLSIEKQKDLLNRYKAFEKKNVEFSLKSRIFEWEDFVTIDKRTFKFWSYKMPEESKSVEKQMYLMCICFDQILILNAPLPKGEDEKVIRGLMEKVAKTLELFPQTNLDIEKLAKQIK